MPRSRRNGNQHGARAERGRTGPLRLHRNGEGRSLTRGPVGLQALFLEKPGLGEAAQAGAGTSSRWTRREPLWGEGGSRLGQMKAAQD